MKKLLVLAILLILAGCTKADSETLRVGTSPGLNAEVLEIVKAEAKKDGFDFEIIPFKDYTKMNVALKQKNIDINCFQNNFYLKKINAENDGLTAVAECYLKPLALYSAKYKSLHDIPADALVYIADDPITAARSLLLLEKAGLVMLERTPSMPALKDITKTSLKIQAVDSSKIRGFYTSSDLIALSFDYAHSINLNPKNSLLHETLPSDFTQLIVTRKDIEGSGKIQQFVKFYQSSEVRKFLQQKYGNNMILAF